MVYIVLTCAVLSAGLVTIACCIFSSMLSREEEREALSM